MLPGSLQGMELRWSWFRTYLPNYLTENLPGPGQITLLKMKNSFLGAGGGGGVAKYGCLPTSQTMAFRTLNTKQLKPSTPRSWNLVFLLENWREEALSN